MNVFISCTKDKRDSRCKAREMYLPSSMFRKSLTYAKKVLKADHIYILSAKHHLLPLSREIDPYNEYLGDFSADERREWAKEVLSQMKSHHIDFNEKTVFLAGSDYCEDLVDEFSDASTPFAHKQQGEILHYLDSKISGVEEIKESYLNSLSDYLDATFS